MRADNTRHIVAAARHRHEYTRAKAVQALREAEKPGTPVTFDAVASAAGVSRPGSTPSRTCEPRSSDSAQSHRGAPGGPVPIRQRASDASLLRRLEAANARIRQLAEENRRLRDQLARALGEQRSARSLEPGKPSSRRLGSTTIGPC